MFEFKRRMLSLKVIFCIAMFFTIFSILVSCDGAARVKGRILRTTSINNGGCNFKVYRLEGNKLIYNFEIEEDFNVDFTISPWAKDYYMMIECDGFKAHKTESYRMGGSKYFETPLDLGEIEMKK